MCAVSGLDVDDCSKNGKKAAEAMSLSKEGKSERYHLQRLIKSVAWHILKSEGLSCMCISYCASMHIHLKTLNDLHCSCFFFFFLSFF